jgi:cobalt-zinc-cadmium efflux system protein
MSKDHGHNSCNHSHSQRHKHEATHGHAGHHHVHIDEHVQLSKSFLWGGVLNLFFVIFEFTFGILSGSVALAEDAVHNFSDVITIFLSWLGFRLNKSKATPQFTYGLKKMSLMIAFFNSLTLILSLIYIIYESYQRFIHPQPLAENNIIFVATVGVIINFFTAFLFRKNHSDVNVKGAYLHMIMDAVISLAVVIVGLIIKYTGLHILDPLIACLIVLVIAHGTWSLLKESFILLLGGVPMNIDIDLVYDYVAHLPEVKAVHDLHIWSISSSEVALTAHLRMKNPVHPGDLFIRNLNQYLLEKFKISHTTIQIEISDESCMSCL